MIRINFPVKVRPQQRTIFQANPAVQAGKPAPEQQVDNNGLSVNSKIYQNHFWKYPNIFISAGHAVSPAHEQQIAAPAAPGDRVKLQEQAGSNIVSLLYQTNKISSVPNGIRSPDIS